MAAHSSLPPRYGICLRSTNACSEIAIASLAHTPPFNQMVSFMSQPLKIQTVGRLGLGKRDWGRGQTY